MSLTIGAFLLVAQGGSVLAGMNERDFCAAFVRNMPQYVGQSVGRVTVRTAVADCPAKRIRLGLSLATEGMSPQSSISSFLDVARAGVCSSEPLMQNFRQRGWKFEYTFLLPDGSTSVETLTC